MSKERISMRKIKEILRLKFENRLSMNKIATCSSISRPTIKEYLMRFNASGIPWPVPDNVNDEELERKLFPRNEKRTGRGDLDYDYLIAEMKRPNVTLALLWEEYKSQNQNGFQYSHFCLLYGDYVKKLNYSMRQEHKAGEKTFVDFGEGLKLIDPHTGEKIQTKLFVSVWGASSYLFAKATTGEDLLNWIDVNISAFEYFGCTSKAIVPDNLKSAVTKACRYEPDINPTYAEFARHYSVVIFPARPYKPKDKPKAENGVLLAKRWILAKLRNHIFYDIAKMNIEIEKLMEIFNGKTMKRLKKSRKELFELLDKPNSQPLPDKRYEFTEWKIAKVNIDYHISFDFHSYSVPYTLIHKEVSIRATKNIVEIIIKGERICSHRRSFHKYGYTTAKEHMPKAHQQYLEWTPQRIMEWADKYGPSVKSLIETIINSKTYAEQAYKSCLGIIRLGNKYPSNLDKACERALAHKIHRYSGVKNILERGLDKLNGNELAKDVMPILHENIRGVDFYGQN